tara:strand:- start:2861 stop:3193 length:333 start_codon:yes stop_codon:yes gene_type:complete
MAAKKTKKKASKKKASSKKTSKKTTKKSPSRSSKKSNMNMTLAVVGLLLNIFLFPGLGSLIGGKTRAGIWQIVLILIGIPLSIILIGIPLIIIAWIWGIVTGVNMIKEAS